MLLGEASATQTHDSGLLEIVDLVGMGIGGSTDGWHRKSARLYAIDVALAVVRRSSGQLRDSAQRELIAHLHEARTMVDENGEIDSIAFPPELETRPATARSADERTFWLIGIDALFPSPYRAAVIATRNALSFGTDDPGDMVTVLRGRLRARLDEASWNVSSANGVIARP